MSNKPNARFNRGDRVLNRAGNEGVIVERDYFDGARLAGMVRVPGIDSSLNAGWKYMVSGEGFDLEKWYDEGSLKKSR